MITQDLPSSDPRLALFDGLPVAVCLVDAEGRLVAMNRRALASWGVEPGSVLGRKATEALGIVPSDGGDAWARLSPPGARPRIPCRITTPEGQTRPVAVIYTALEGTAAPLGALFIVEGDAADLLTDLPRWALHDPVTGLGNRHLWEREVPRWSARSGCLAFFDLDDLKEVNDLHGHVAGDRTLAAVGQALVACAPPEALTVRYGGDEFVVLLPDDDLAAVEAWAQSAVRHVALAAPSANLPIVPRLSHGVAPFAPGGLRDAVQQADDVLYERKGVLFRAAGGGRIILTREGRTGLRGPGDNRGQPPAGAFSAGFGPEFDGYFRAAFARAVTQAQEFIGFVGPAEGDAVVEVGAGAGRITFDGGLARRVGPLGQLLVTDPSGAQLQQARQRAARLGLDWVHFLRAPAEELPLASNTADLVLGSTFLHFTEPERALREMARVVRPGARLALQQPVAFAWPDLWLEILEPLQQAAGLLGLPFGHFLPTEEALHGYLAGAGLEIERCRLGGPDRVDFGTAQIAVAFWRQATVIPMMLRGISAKDHAEIREAFEARIRERFDRARPEERQITGQWVEVVARKQA